MNMKRLFLLFGAIAGAFTSCTQGSFDKMVDRTVKPKVDYIHPDTLTTDTNYLFLDAREPKEFEVSHLEGAKCVGYDEVDFSSLEGTPKDQPIVVYCSIGYRSNEVAAQLVEKGYSNVYNMYGGIFYWINHDKPLVDQAGSTAKVHGYNRLWSRWVEKGEVILK